MGYILETNELKYLTYFISVILVLFDFLSFEMKERFANYLKSHSNAEQYYSSKLQA